MKGGYLICAMTLLATLLVTGVVRAETELIPIPGDRQAGEFVLPDTDGDMHRLSDYRGRYVLVNFWTSGCEPCERQMLSMQQLYSRHHGRALEILAVHAGPGTAKMHAEMERSGAEFPVLVDADLALVGWRVAGLPTSFLLDPAGRMIYWAQGPVDWDSDTSRALVGRLLGAGASRDSRHLPATGRG